MDDQRDNKNPLTRDADKIRAVARSWWELIAHPVRKVCYEPLAAHYDEKYRKRYPKHHSKVLILDLALLFILGGLTVFWIFANTILPLFPVPAIVSIEMPAPKSIVSGAATDFVISYRNDSPQTLPCAELRIILPEDTVLEAEPLKTEKSEKTCYVEKHPELFLDPAQPEVHVIELGAIGPEGFDTVRFRARTYGATGSVKTMTAELRYWEEGATQSTRVSTRNEWQVTGSTLALDLEAPDVAGRGQARTVRLSYENKGEDALKGAIIRLAVPEDFTVTGSAPAASARGEWRLGDLAPGRKGAITVFGYFRPSPSDAAPTFTARGYVQAGGKLTLAELTRKNADPGAADLELTADLDSPAGREALLPGEQVRVKLAYRNTGKRDLKNMRIAVDPGGAALENPSPVTLAWDPDTEPSLAVIRPGATGAFTAVFVVPQVLEPGVTKPALHLSAAAHYEVDGEPDHTVRIDTPVFDLPIATRLTVAGTALYYTKDGDQLGIGPLPPKVGETTKYRVFLTVETTTGAADGVIVEATLPQDVEWTGQASVTAGESLDHLPTARKVRWTVGRVPEGVGEETKFGATFEVAITPGKDLAGSAPLLLQDIKVTGKDEATGLALHAAAENISTDLPYDRRAAGKGTVTE